MRSASSMLALTLTLLGGAAIAPRAEAQCLPASERAAFRAELLAVLTASGVTPERLYRRAYDRLGFGPAPGRPDAMPPATSNALEVLADRLIAELTDANVIDTAADTFLAGLTRSGTVAGTEGLSPFPLHHARLSMAESYTELSAFGERARALRAQALALPQGPARAALMARAQRLGKSGLRTRGDLVRTASARGLYHPLVSANGDIGALLTEFWFNHFNVDASKSYWAASGYRDTLQQGLCGDFRGLLGAVAKHPAMLVYLDNHRSRRGAINENFARELMELHTFGDDRLQNYTQADVVGVARALTGWTIDYVQRTGGLVSPEFQFLAGAHDRTALTLFAGAPAGVTLTLPEATRGAGLERGEQLLDYLAAHTATQRNLCSKLSLRIVGAASRALVDGCVARWGTRGNLAVLYRYFLTRPELWRANVPGKQKNPLELWTSAFRAIPQPASRITSDWLGDAVTQVNRLGLPVAQFVVPTGYTDDPVWITPGLLIQWNRTLFTNLYTDGLTMVDGTTTLSGYGVEAPFRLRVAAAGTSVAELRAIGSSIARDLLRYPNLVPSSDTAYSALLEPDLRNANNSTMPLRSYIHALLAQPAFLTK
jgi:hypothetical protein